MGYALYSLIYETHKGWYSWMLQVFCFSFLFFLFYALIYETRKGWYS